MKTEQTLIETTGTIKKKETLATLEEAFCAKALVIESKFPYPGYYQPSVPDVIELNPDSIYLITRGNIDEIKLMRINQQIKKSYTGNFDAALGKITVFNELQPCIRLKFLKEYNDIPELVDRFRQQDIHFLKYRQIEPYTGLIDVKKYFVLETIEPGIYRDREVPEMSYIQIPGFLNWDNFERITLDMKHNLEDNKFDAAVGTIYRKNCLIDIVRIYDKHFSLDKLYTIRSKYKEAINKLNTA